MVDLSKFIFNKNVSNEFVALGQIAHCPLPNLVARQSTGLIGGLASCY